MFSTNFIIGCIEFFANQLFINAKKEDDKIESLRHQINDLKRAQSVAINEAARARTVANNISKLLS